MHTFTLKCILSALLLSLLSCLCLTYSSIKPDSAKGSSKSDLPLATEEEAADTPMLDNGSSIAAGYSNSLTYYSQGDPAWSSYPYGGSDPMASYGCGPTALAIAVTSLTGNAVTPVDMADWSAANGYFSRGHGSAHDLIPNGARAFGLTVERLSILTPEAIRTTLSYRKLLVLLMGPGDFSDSGHFIIIYGYLADGTLLIADPASTDRSSRSWPVDQILSQVATNAKAGGPVWVLSK